MTQTGNNKEAIEIQCLADYNQRQIINKDKLIIL